MHSVKENDIVSTVWLTTHNLKKSSILRQFLVDWKGLSGEKNIQVLEISGPFSNVFEIIVGRVVGVQVEIFSVCFSRE